MLRAGDRRPHVISSKASNTCPESHLAWPSNPSRRTFSLDSEMASQAFQVLVGERLDGSVHAFGLAIGPRVTWLGQRVPDAVFLADTVEDVSTEHGARHASNVYLIDRALLQQQHL